MGANNQSIKNLSLTNTSGRKQRRPADAVQSTTTAQPIPGIIISFSTSEGYTVELLTINNLPSGVTYTGVSAVDPSATFAVNDRVTVQFSAGLEDPRIAAASGGGGGGNVVLLLANRFFSA